MSLKSVWVNFNNLLLESFKFILLKFRFCRLQMCLMVEPSAQRTVMSIRLS